MKDKNTRACVRQLYERCVVRKARVIADHSSHVLAKHYELLSSGRRFGVPKSNTVTIEEVMSVRQPAIVISM